MKNRNLQLVTKIGEIFKDMKIAMVRKVRKFFVVLCAN